jgi:endonuclease YncB( thermonuclease family)
LPVRAAEEWRTLTNCTLIQNRANDGDSFHVRHDRREYIFRLYFVDTPETDDRFPERVDEQAKYFHISKLNALAVGRQAARFTAHELIGHFTVITRWQDARGQSKLPRQYAIIELHGKDLGEELVKQGLARIHGTKANRPDGPSAKEVIANLERLEQVAKEHHRGAWGFSAIDRQDR